MMKKVGVAILGLGVVGGGTYKILTEHREFYQRTQNVDIEVENVLVRNREKARALGVPEECIAGSIAEVIANPAVDIVIECIGGVEAAKDYVLAALHEGKSVVTSNKELICKYSHELERTARRNCCGLYFEASCVGGVPIIRTLLDGVQANRITEMMGIINGTTNFILTKMAEENEDYAAALKEAQRLGYAEADPTNDVEGYDAMYKLSILSSLAFHTKVPYGKVCREGISSVDKVDIAFGKQLGYTLKLLAIGKIPIRESRCGCIPPLSKILILSRACPTASTPSISRATPWTTSCCTAAGRARCPRAARWSATSFMRRPIPR